MPRYLFKICCVNLLEALLIRHSNKIKGVNLPADFTLQKQCFFGGVFYKKN